MTNDTTPAPEGVTPAAVADLARRLRGEYRIPITDGLGAAGGEEPDNPHEFVRTFPSPPIQKDAAAMLEALAAALAAQKARADALADRLGKETADHDATDRRCKRLVARIQAAEAKVAALEWFAEISGDEAMATKARVERAISAAITEVQG